MRRSFLPLFCLALAACTESPTAPDPNVLARELPLPEGPVGAWIRSVGNVTSSGDSLLVHVPAQVRRGETLAAAVTVNIGGCTGTDTTTTTVSGLTATVVPYVRSLADVTAALCLAGVVAAPMTGPIVFTQTGVARVRFVVRTGRDNTLQVVERRVQVTD